MWAERWYVLLFVMRSDQPVKRGVLNIMDSVLQKIHNLYAVDMVRDSSGWRISARNEAI